MNDMPAWGGFQGNAVPSRVAIFESKRKWSRIESVGNDWLDCMGWHQYLRHQLELDVHAYWQKPNDPCWYTLAGRPVDPTHEKGIRRSVAWWYRRRRERGVDSLH